MLRLLIQMRLLIQTEHSQQPVSAATYSQLVVSSARPSYEHCCTAAGIRERNVGVLGVIHNGLHRLFKGQSDAQKRYGSE